MTRERPGTTPVPPVTDKGTSGKGENGKLTNDSYSRSRGRAEEEERLRREREKGNAGTQIGFGGSGS